MAGVPVRPRCTCRHLGTWLATPAQSWTCPECAREWVPDAAAVATATRGADELARLRHLVVGLVVATIAIAALLIVIYTDWVLGAPVLIGGVLLAFKPTYNKRRDQALAFMRTSIPMSESTRTQSL